MNGLFKQTFLKLALSKTNFFFCCQIFFDPKQLKFNFYFVRVQKLNFNIIKMTFLPHVRNKRYYFLVRSKSQIFLLSRIEQFLPK